MARKNGKPEPQQDPTTTEASSEDVGSARPSNEPNLRDYFSMLYRRKGVIITVFLVTSAAVTVRALLTPPVYTATTSLLVRFGREFIYQSEVGGLDSAKTFSLEEMVNSQVEILKSRDLARKVVEEIGVNQLFPELLAKEMEAHPENTDAAHSETLIARCALVFADSLAVNAVFESSVIRVSFTHFDAELAARALNILIDKFKEKHLEVFGDSKSAFLRGQLKEKQLQLDRAEQELQAFRKRNQVFQAEAQEDAILSQTAQLETQLHETQLRIGEVRHTLGALGNGAPVPSEVSTRSKFSSERGSLLDRRNELLRLLREVKFRASDLSQQYRSSTLGFTVPAATRSAAGRSSSLTLDIDRLRSIDEAFIRLLDLELRERTLLGTHRPESRELSSVHAEIAIVKKFLREREQQLTQNLRAVIRVEWKALRGKYKTLGEQLDTVDRELASIEQREREEHEQGLQAELEALGSKEKTLTEAIAQKGEELANLNSVAIELRRLERELTVQETGFTNVLEKLRESETVDDLLAEKIVNLRVIENATPPVTPSGLSKKLLIALGIALGSVAGVGVALVLELWSR